MVNQEENNKSSLLTQKERIYSILEEQAKKMFAEIDKEKLRNFKGTPMKLEYAKTEIKRYFDLGLDKSDVACLVASWGLNTEDLEKANNFVHTLIQKGEKLNLQEGIIL